ncbi:MAG: hypothetical protein WC781_01555 [Candidatus Pacearchaeota archaeon]|jgi:hypothetical protein
MTNKETPITSYDKLRSNFQLAKEYPKEEVLSKLEKIGLAGKGIIGFIKGQYNLNCLHDELGNRTLFMKEGLAGAYFKNIGWGFYRFETDYDV